MEPVSTTVSPGPGAESGAGLIDRADAMAPVLAFFKALAHESRLRLLGLVAQRAHSVQELAGALALSEATVSHHLGLLKSLGLVSMRADGTTHWYALEPQAIRRLAQSVLSRGQIAALAPTSNAFDARVLSAFVGEDGRLTRIPAQRKKRRAVLVWLMTLFEPGRRYREAEVNALLQTRHQDQETLRRELVGHKMLARERSVYWRLPESGWDDY